MTKLTHTPGPWQAANIEDYPASPDSVCSAQEPDREIAEVTSGNPADKALVIAAPDMLEALKLCFRQVDILTQCDPNDEEAQESRDACRDAIAKATGGDA